MDLNTLKVIHSGKITLNSKRNTYVLTQNDYSDRKLGTFCLSMIEQKRKHSFLLLMLFFLLFFFTGIGEHQAAGNKSSNGQHKFVAAQFADNDCDRHTLSVFC